MKKVLSFILVVVMVMSMAVPASALVSPGAKQEDLSPVLTNDSSAIVALHTTETVQDLSEEVQQQMVEAKETLKETCPEGFAVKYFFYLEIIGQDQNVDVSFEAIDCDEIVFMQYINGEWVELKHTINDDGTITILGAVEGTLAVFTK